MTNSRHQGEREVAGFNGNNPTGLTLVNVHESQALHSDQRLHTQSTAGGSGSSTPLEGHRFVTELAQMSVPVGRNRRMTWSGYHLKSTVQLLWSMFFVQMFELEAAEHMSAKERKTRRAEFVSWLFTLTSPLLVFVKMGRLPFAVVEMSECVFEKYTKRYVRSFPREGQHEKETQRGGKCEPHLEFASEGQADCTQNCGAKGLLSRHSVNDCHIAKAHFLSFGF